MENNKTNQPLPPEENKLIPVVVVQDNDDHWYVIPKNLRVQFYELLEKAERDNDHIDFLEVFDDYMTGGDINNVQLYANV
jgi:hypothetical protein